MAKALVLQGVTAGEFDRFGNVAERNEPVSFTRHKLVPFNRRLLDFDLALD